MNSKKKTNSKAVSDNLLIRRFKEDDTSAFDGLVVKYKDMIFNLCFRIMGDYDEANDCAQETFIKVYKNLNKFRAESSFSTWLYRIAINTCRNRVSSLKRRNRNGFIRINNPGDDTAAIDIRDTTYTPEEIYEHNEKRQIIAEAINLLPADLRILVVLRDIEGKSYEEIAQITGVKSGTVKSRLARARHHLREKLRGII